MGMKSLLCAGIALALIAPWPAHADEADDLAGIRREIDELKASYEARIRALEARLEQLQKSAAGTAAAPAVPASASAPASTSASAPASTSASASAPAPVPASASAQAQPSTPAPASPIPAGRGEPPRQAAGANAFNPAISLILSGLYTSTSQDPANYAITGFPVPEGTEVGPGERGLSLAESELAISASIDPYLRGALRLALEPDNSVAVEEAFIQTTGLSRGVTIKAGRFLSGIGYLNEQHRHYWDFVDSPLAYQAFLGSQFGDDGVQLRWLAPTDTFVEFGAEIGGGRAYPATGSRGNGAGSGAVYAHLGGDAGPSNAWRAGLSLLQASPRDQVTTVTGPAGDPVSNSFSGRSRLWLADLVWKWAPDGNPARRNFKLQAEYLRRQQSGELVYALDGAAIPGAFDTTQSGWYLQGVYQFMPRWRLGLRTERLATGSQSFAAQGIVVGAPDYAPSRNSAMIDFSPSEFSRFRLQFARDKSRQDAPDNQIFLQYQTNLGAHGAHQI